MIQLEVCIDSVASAINAEQGGAQRVELCDNLVEGGTTPSAGSIEVVRENSSIGLQVIIRPRGGDFLYDAYEWMTMKKDVREAQRRGADGVVIGLLTRAGQVDRERTRELLELARPMNVTFHRAFDMTAEPFRALNDLVEIGVDRILTSGQQVNAPAGAELIRELVQRANGELIIMPGGGINEDNIATLVRETGVSECHVSGRIAVPSTMEYRNSRVHMGQPDRSEYERLVTDPKRIRHFVQLLNP